MSVETPNIETYNLNNPEYKRTNKHFHKFTFAIITIGVVLLGVYTTIKCSPTIQNYIEEVNTKPTIICEEEDDNFEISIYCNNNYKYVEVEFTVYYYISYSSLKTPYSTKTLKGTNYLKGQTYTFTEVKESFTIFGSFTGEATLKDFKISR